MVLQPEEWAEDAKTVKSKVNLVTIHSSFLFSECPLCPLILAFLPTLTLALDACTPYTPIAWLPHWSVCEQTGCG